MSTSAPPIGSYHNHPGYCDGSGTVAAYADAALAAGLTSLGLSCHAPVPFACDWTMPLPRLPEYRQEARAAQAAYQGRLPIYLGLEVDYLSPGVAGDGAAFQREHILSAGLDYIVASVHFVGLERDGAPWTVDNTGESFARQLEEVYAGDVRRLIEDYFALTVELAAAAPGWGVPVIVGHLDKAKMWNIGGRYFSEESDWYLTALERVLQAIQAAGLTIEINTAGLRRPHGEPYPGPRALHRAHHLGIPLTISADAHKPEDVAARFGEAAAIARDAGYREIVTLRDGRWARQPIN